MPEHGGAFIIACIVASSAMINKSRTSDYGCNPSTTSVLRAMGGDPVPFRTWS